MTKNSRKRRAAKARREALEFEMGYVGAEEAAPSEQDEENIRRDLVSPEQALDEEETKDGEPQNDIATPEQETIEAARPVQEATVVLSEVFPSSASVGWKTAKTADSAVPRSEEVGSVAAKPSVEQSTTTEAMKESVIAAPTGWQSTATRVPTTESGIAAPTGWQSTATRAPNESVMAEATRRQSTTTREPRGSNRPTPTMHQSTATREPRGSNRPAPMMQPSRNRYGPRGEQPRDHSQERRGRSRSRERGRRSMVRSPPRRRDRSLDRRSRSIERMRSPPRKRDRSLDRRSRSMDRMRSPPRQRDRSWDRRSRSIDRKRAKYEIVMEPPRNIMEPPRNITDARCGKYWIELWGS